MSTANTICLDVRERVYDEGVLDTASSPGCNVKMAADGKYDPAAAVADDPCRILVEDGLQGLGVEDAYAVGSLGRFITPQPGDKLVLRVLDGETIAKGGTIDFNAAGKGIASLGKGLFTALEACAPDGADGYCAAMKN